MKMMWKLKSANADDIIATVVNTAAFSTTGVANGRTVPVVILQSDSESKIDAVIDSHFGMSEGNCQSQWGCTNDRNTILLHLEFREPVAVKIVIPLDIIHNGATIDQIIHTQCLYIMTGTPGMKLSQNLRKERILIEVPSREFADEWRKLYKKKYCKYLRKTHHISSKTAEEVFDKMQDEFSCIKKLRMK